MKRATMRLKLFRREHGLTEAQAAAKFDTTRMTWRRWEGGKMVPGPAHMIALYAAGVAEPNDFYDLPELVPARKAA